MKRPAQVAIWATRVAPDYWSECDLCGRQSAWWEMPEDPSLTFDEWREQSWWQRPLGRTYAAVEVCNLHRSPNSWPGSFWDRVMAVRALDA